MEPAYASNRILWRPLDRFPILPRPARQCSLRSPPPRPCTSAGDSCSAVLHGWDIVRTTTFRQDAGAGTLRDFVTTMNVHEERLGRIERCVAHSDSPMKAC